MMSGQKRRATLSPVENMMLGVFGGCLETMVHMPLLTWKFCKQNSKPLPNSIIGWYRGLVVQASSVAPITALQVTTNGIIESLITQNQRNVTDNEKLFTSATAGFISALIYSPVDLITIQQQNQAKAMTETFKIIFNEYGFRGLSRGFFSCGLRECVYSCGYLGMAPVLTDFFKRRNHHSADTLPNQSESSDFLFSLYGAISAGIISTYVTHPVDTIKTLLQADISRKRFSNMLAAGNELFQKGGVRAFYKGAVPRCIRTMGAFFIISFCREKWIQWKTKNKKD